MLNFYLFWLSAEFQVPSNFPSFKLLDAGKNLLPIGFSLLGKQQHHDEDVDITHTEWCEEFPKMFPVFQLTALISMAVALFIFCMLLTCLMVRKSARRTILLTTPLVEGKEKTGLTPVEVHPVYMWMVQPKEETRLKEGKISLTRSSQKILNLRRENLQKSSYSSLHTESSSDNLSRASSITSIISYLSRSDSVTTRVSNTSNSSDNKQQE